MKFINDKFDAMSKRLDKLEVVEKKVSELDIKLNKLWDDLDKRVTKTADKLETVHEIVDIHEFDIEKTRESVSMLQAENKSLKESVADLQANSMACNLIIGGIKEDAGTINEAGATHETGEQTVEKVRAYLKDDLKIPETQVKTIGIESARRIGARRGNKPQNILVSFKDVKTKNVKSFKENVDFKATGLFMHDQFPQEIVNQRKKLIPIMKKARADKKDAYIKYNKLIVDGEVYTDGKYGNIA